MSFWDYGWGGWNPWVGRAEKSHGATQRENYAKDQFDRIRKRLERTKVANNELLIRNGCRDESESQFKLLPEITLVHIFQYARPPNFQAEQEAARKEDQSKEPRKYQAYLHDSHYLQYRNRMNGDKKDESAEDAAKTADEKEMATAAGIKMDASLVPTEQPAASGAAAAGGAASAGSSTKPKGRNSGRKRSTEISYNENAGDKEFEKQLAAFDRQKPTKPAKGFASLDTNKDSDAEDDDDEEKELLPALEIIDSLHEPGKKHTIHLLNPDTHITGPCWRDFSRYVKTWTAKRVEATPEERKKFRFYKKGKAYFIKVIHTNPGSPTKKKAPKKKKPAAKKKRSASDGEDVVTHDDILAEAATLAAQQREALDSKKPAKKKQKKGKKKA